MIKVTEKYYVKPILNTAKDSKGNSADSHMWEVFTYVNIWGDSLMLWRKKYFRKFKNNNINYNLKELFKNFD